MRHPNIQRLPSPPVIKGGLVNHDADIKTLSEHVSTMTTILNQALQGLQNSVNTIQQTGAQTPPPVSGLTVTGKQGLFHLTWNRVANVDGYVVTHASDTGMKQLVGRYSITDGNQVTHQIPVGNVAVKGSFQVYAYQGNKYSDPSPAVTATTATYSTSESAPAAPPIAPLQPKVSPVRSGPNL